MKQGQFIHPKQLYRAKRALQRERCRSLDRYLVEIKGVEKESVRSFWVWGQTQENSELVKAYPPWLQYRFGGRLSFEDHGQTDSREYSGWIWRNLYGKPLELRVEDEADPEWTTANGRQLAVRKWQAGSIPGTYPLPLELFA